MTRIARLLLAATALLSCAAPATPEIAPPQIDAERHLGAPVQVDNLTVWPVHTSAPVSGLELQSLHEAREQGLAVIREKGSGRHRGSASVGELVIENRGERPLLVTAGTILKGGKQDRQLGQDLVVDAGATVPVDAFCVERGRWSGLREGQSTDGVFEVPKVKASKRLRAAAHYKKDQGAVWEQVDVVNRKANKAPDTLTFLATAEEDDGAARATLARLEAAVRSHFAGLGDEVVGFAYSVNGEPLAMRTFANRQILDSQLDPFVSTMSLEAQVAQLRDREAGRAVYDQPASSEALLEMVRGIDQARVEVRETAGLNRNHSRSNDWGGRSACRIEHDGDWIAVTEDWTAPAAFSESVRKKMLELEALGYTDH